MSIPTYQGSVGIMRTVQACLEAELPAVLATASTGLGVTLDNVRSFWRGEIEPGDLNTPGCGVYVIGSTYLEASGAQLYNVEHEVVIRLVVAESNASAYDASTYTDALHAYAQAACYTLSRYYVVGYGAAVGAITASVIDSTPQAYAGDADRGEWMQTLEVRVLITQRVARWEA